MLVPMDGMWIWRMWNPDEFSVIFVEVSMVGSSFFSLVLLPPPIWKNETKFYNIIQIKMENCHVFCKSTAVVYAVQLIHLALLPNPLTAMKRVGVK